MVPEEKLLKRYIETRKKEYMEFAKQAEKTTITGAYELKEHVTQVTIEGEHTCLFLMKRVGDPQKSELYELEITPILNAPHQMNRISVPLTDIKAVMTYRYMFERKSIRIITRLECKEYLLQFKNQKHKDKALKTILKFAEPYLDQNLQKFETSGLFTDSERPRQHLSEFT